MKKVFSSLKIKLFSRGRFGTEERQKIKEAFLSVDKDNDCRITFAQMKKLFQNLYLKDGHQSSFSALKHFWAIKIDFMTFLDFLEKYHLLQLLDKLNEAKEEELDEYTRKQLFQGSDSFLFIMLTEISYFLIFTI